MGRRVRLEAELEPHNDTTLSTIVNGLWKVVFKINISIITSCGEIPVLASRRWQNEVKYTAEQKYQPCLKDCRAIKLIWLERTWRLHHAAPVDFNITWAFRQPSTASISPYSCLNLVYHARETCRRSAATAVDSAPRLVYMPFHFLHLPFRPPSAIDAL